MIPDEVVEEVRSRADIVGVIGAFVPLKKAGKDYKGLSPFKPERTPSFYVVPAKGFFHDFSSGESGDVFSFLMKHQGMSFTDAVKFVGARSGVEVREVRKGRGGDDPWRTYYEASSYASAFFQERLWEGRGGSGAREYLEKRGIDRSCGEQFGLGYAPKEWEAFREAASVHGIEEGILTELGLLKKSRNRDKSYDAFRGRIIFPIESVSGRVLAFGGRILGQPRKGAPKYINSPDHPIFRKGEVLYGLGRAKNDIRREGCALLVEGFMDVVSLAAVDIRNAVAPLGTALTETQAELLERYTTQACLLFDSDPAGLRATFRAADLLLSRGVHPTVVTLPDGEDPDSVARSGGADAIRGYMRRAVDVLDRKIGILEEREYFSSIEKTRRALDRLLPTLRAPRDTKLRDLYLARVSERTGVRPETLAAELKRPEETRISVRKPSVPAERLTPRIHGRGPERTLLLLLVRNRKWVDRASERISPSDLEDGINRAIFEMLIADPELTVPPEGTETAAVRRFERLMADPEETAPSSQIFEDTISRIQAARIDRRLGVIDREIGNTEEEAEKSKLAMEKEKLIKEKRDLGVDWRHSAWHHSARQALRGQGERAP